MTRKQKILETVQSLPDDVSLEQVMDRLLVLAKIERGLAQADAGEMISHEDVKKRMSAWLE